MPSRFQVQEVLEGTNSFRVVTSFGNALLKMMMKLMMLMMMMIIIIIMMMMISSLWYPLIVSSWLCVCVLKTRRIGSMDFFGTSNLDVMSMQLQGEGKSVAPVNRCDFTP